MELEPPLPVSEIAVRAGRRRRRRRARVTVLTVATLGLAALAVARLPITAATELDTAGPAAAEVSTGDSGTDGTYHGASGGGWNEVGEPLTSPSTTADASSSSAVPDGATGDGGEEAGGDTSTTTPTAGSEGSTDPPAGGAGTTVPAPQTSPGITVATSTPSAWDTGYCLRVEVTNGTAGPVSWQVVLELDGTVDSVWSATVEAAGNGALVFHGEQDYNDTLDGGEVTSFGTCLTTGGA